VEAGRVRNQITSTPLDDRYGGLDPAPLEIRPTLLKPHGTVLRSMMNNPTTPNWISSRYTTLSIEHQETHFLTSMRVHALALPGVAWDRSYIIDAHVSSDSWKDVRGIAARVYGGTSSCDRVHGRTSNRTHVHGSAWRFKESQKIASRSSHRFPSFGPAHCGRTFSPHRKKNI